MNPPPDFRPIPTALIERAHNRLDELASATDSQAQLAAIYLAIGELQDAIKMLPEEIFNHKKK